MDKKKQLIDQTRLVIHHLEKDYDEDIKSGVLQLIYKRYKNALKILENNHDMKKINIGINHCIL
ncbi:hypothetical protein P5G51_004880 [Virgibacillus sp. 179-BFC.A HS]|uniref:Uncharacterized protein n=1 Tax=Tigheibacillus jepli TaxID=3035914 RepID=A0ABU5CES0_9BACI|nr:hypothetical protein [Virgibacillus sp. 179-BFC.A HS]MDY0404824.1 hypothetical protein [Virgibacillus sp. 179-BFC.A HS]